ncbi:MAG: hypothetical protein ACR652_06510 [Methylocystis sp.]|uniref:hypothetical protein n=1 Tax=Methylocystis sp. TaxID=1911079 RepID=UPI003DA587E9
MTGALSPAFGEDEPRDAPTGHVTIQQVQIAFMGSGALGGGTLEFQGKTHKFKIGGLGVGGIGASRLSASGDVYGLSKLSDFEGAYGELRTGWAVGDTGKGRFWLRNPKGVYLKLHGTREGLQLSGGAEAVVIKFD